MAADTAPGPQGNGEETSAERGAETGDLSESILKRILRGAGSDALKYFPVRFIPALTSLITVPLFTRLIGPEDYGYFYLVTSAATFVASIVTAWLSSSAVRFYWATEKEGRTDEYVATVLWSALVALVGAGVLVGAGALLLQGSIGEGLARLVPAGIAYFFFHYLINLLLQVLRAANRASSFAKLSVANTALTTTLSIVFVWPLEMGSLGILLGVAIGNLVLMPFALRAVRREGSLSPAGYSRPLLGEFLSYGVPLIPVGISSWVLVLADRYMIQFFRGATEVGLYSVAYGLGEKLMQLVTLPLIMTMTPVLMETYEKRSQQMAEKVQSQFTRYAAMVTFPLLAGMAATSELFMRAFTGVEFWPAAIVLPFVAAAAMFSAFAQLAGTGLGLHKKSQIIMQNTLAAAAFNIIANAVLIPVYGYPAAGVTTVLSYLLLLAMTWLRSRAYMPWRVPWTALMRIAAASLIMAAVLSLGGYVPVRPVVLLVAAVAVGLIVYGAALLLLGGVRRDELHYAREILAGLMRRLGHPTSAENGPRADGPTGESEHASTKNGEKPTASDPDPPPSEE
jgi:O-antigen/teichoic acid export membrane protein